MAEYEWQSADDEHQHYLDAADTSQGNGWQGFTMG